MQRLSLKSLFYITFLWASAASAGPPNVVLISVDTLRADHLSAYGYTRQTSPRIDALLAQGRRFDQAYTVEPLTAPACTSMLTGRYPHDHGAVRNGVPMFANMISLPKLLALKNYQTAAFISNWTLKTDLVGLGEHFGHYGEVFTRKRWLGLLLDEATGEDITQQGLAWVKRQNGPFFVWVHYSEPHAPYRYRAEHAAALGLPARESARRVDRYDSEIAFCDTQIGHFLDGLWQVSPPEETLVIFVADHGECLGENQYWGHGRHLYQANLRIPMAFVWPGHIPTGVENAPASLLDLPRTVLGLLQLPQPETLAGLDWSTVWRGAQQADNTRTLFFQAHKGAVQSQKAVERSRRRGLLEVGMLRQGRKESWRVRQKKQRLFDLNKDPDETNNLAERDSNLSEILRNWALTVEAGLNRAATIDEGFSEQDAAMMRSLGYID